MSISLKGCEDINDVLEKLKHDYENNTNSENNILYACLLYHLNPNDKWKQGDAAVMINTIRNNGPYCEEIEELLCLTCVLDRDNSIARNHIIRILASGDNENKNNMTPIYSSFYKSRLREINLLPIISNYLFTDNKRQYKTGHLSEIILFKNILSLAEILFYNPEWVTTLLFEIHENICLLPFVYSLFPNINHLELIEKPESKPLDNIDFLQKINTSKLESLTICSVLSLSSLLQCDLTSLKKITITGNHLSKSTNEIIVTFPHLKTLELIDCQVDTSCLDVSKLEKIISRNSLGDLSFLANSDLSNLQMLNIEGTKVTDISALHEANLKSLKELNLDYTSVSDLSVLRDCKNLKLSTLSLNNTLVEDLTFIYHLDTSVLKVFQLNKSKINADSIASLECLYHNNAPHDSMLEVNAYSTPLSKQIYRHCIQVGPLLFFI